MNRRRVLELGGTALAVGLAGCTGGGGNGNGDDGNGGNGNGGGNGDGNTVPGSEYPSIDEWMTETSIGAADATYNGELMDLRGQDSVTIEVGAQGNNGFYAYAPNAIVVSQGTEITWVWTGKGQTHNVEAIPGEQLGESDYEFSSGTPVADEGTEYKQTMDKAGIALYHCEPHLALGMKGGIAVE